MVSLTSVWENGGIGLNGAHNEDFDVGWKGFGMNSLKESSISQVWIERIRRLLMVWLALKVVKILWWKKCN
ncbi:hypothetical protein P8452_28737 [Trifolium repens]|nr:hypothetical protein P8452_28737 [Trifolium repens]